jgi:hypothetical protein
MELRDGLPGLISNSPSDSESVDRRDDDEDDKEEAGEIGGFAACIIERARSLFKSLS